MACSLRHAADMHPQNLLLLLTSSSSMLDVPAWCTYDVTVQMYFPHCELNLWMLLCLQAAPLGPSDGLASRPEPSSSKPGSPLSPSTSFHRPSPPSSPTAAAYQRRRSTSGQEQLYTHLLCISPDAPTNPVLYWLGNVSTEPTRFLLESAKGPLHLDLGDVLYAPNLMIDAHVSCAAGCTDLLMHRVGSIHMMIHIVCRCAMFICTVRRAAMWCRCVSRCCLGCPACAHAGTGSAETADSADIVLQAHREPGNHLLLILHLLPRTTSQDTHTLHCTLQGRYLLWGWLQERRKVGSYDYAGCLGVPRILRLRGDRLIQEPAPEVANLRLPRSLRMSHVIVHPERSTPLEGVDDALAVDMTLQLDRCALCTGMRSCATTASLHALYGMTAIMCCMPSVAFTVEAALEA